MWRSGPHAKIFKFVITAICDVTYSHATHMKKLTWNVSSVSSDYLALISLNIKTYQVTDRTICLHTFMSSDVLVPIFLSKTSYDLMENLYNFKTIRDRQFIFSQKKGKTTRRVLVK